MPTVQVQQLHCAREVQVFKSCRCQNISTLSARVSNLRLYDDNLVFASRGFSSIVIPSKGYSPTKKSTKVSPPSKASKTRCADKSINDILECNKPPKPFHETRNSYNSRSARQQKSSPSCDSTQTKNKTNDSEITKRLLNVHISGRNVDYKHFSVQKKESSKRGGSTKSNNNKCIEPSGCLDTFMENKDKVMKDNPSHCKAGERLHPGWRRVPWKPHFGWTDYHQELSKTLRQEVKNGGVESIYYNTEQDHTKAGALLGGPWVSKVSDVLEVIRKVTSLRSPWHYKDTTKSRSEQPSHYDADDEDSV